MLYRICFFVVVSHCSLPAIGSAGEAYYLLMFGSQTIPNDSDNSHTWATFVKATWEGEYNCLPPNAAVHLCQVTISWLPENGVVRTLALLPECGRNWGLDETIRLVQKNCQRVSLWGAYRICPELYNLAAKQVNLLESGEVRYKALDMGRRTDRVCNCIHACSSIVGGYRTRVAAPGWGEMASYTVLRRYERYIISENAEPWVGSAIGLDAYPIIYRDYTNPRSGFFGPIYRALGGERDLVATYGPPVR